MKRDHSYSIEKGNPHSRHECFSSCGSGSSTSSSVVAGKGKMFDDAGDDELLAAVGLKVKSSDMAEVAQKIEQLEEFMGNVQQNGLSHLSSETVHYNPSDLSSFLESMIFEFNPVTTTSCTHDSSTAAITSLDNNSSTNNTSSFFSRSVVFEDSSFDSDLNAIPGNAVFPQQLSPANNTPVAAGSRAPQPQAKRMKRNYSQSDNWGAPVEPATPVAPNRAVVLVDPQDNGIRLVHALMACAEVIQQENLKVAEALVKQIGILAVSQAGAMRKVATYFAEALARRIYNLFPANQNDSGFNDLLQMHFYEASPYLKFAHFTANQAILEAFTGKDRVHVIDFSLKQGMQWPALLQALALRPGGPPRFRLTAIELPLNDKTEHLQEVGCKLAQLAETINVEFEFRGLGTSSLSDLHASMFDVCDDETVVVNSIFELHQLLARPGAIEKVLSVVRDLRPEIFTVVEQEANHNGPVFLDRFTESLHYYSTLFDSLEGCSSSGGNAITDEDKLMSEVYLGRQICNVVACEGLDRVERHETLAQWRTRFSSADFKPVYLGSNAFKQASMLLALFAGGNGYMVEENNGCLMLGWQAKPLLATSAWMLA